MKRHLILSITLLAGSGTISPIVDPGSASEGGEEGSYGQAGTQELGSTVARLPSLRSGGELSQLPVISSAKPTLESGVFVPPSVKTTIPELSTDGSTGEIVVPEQGSSDQTATRISKHKGDELISHEAQHLTQQTSPTPVKTPATDVEEGLS